MSPFWRMRTADCSMTCWVGFAICVRLWMDKIVSVEELNRQSLMSKSTC